MPFIAEFRLEILEFIFHMQSEHLPPLTLTGMLPHLLQSLSESELPSLS